MANRIVFLAVMIMVLLGNKTNAIVNGSFEDDGVIFDLTTEEPNGWAEVVIDANNFGGWVYNTWATDGSYNLTIYAQAYQAFEPNDIAMVSQDVYLSDVNQIYFDIQLDTQSGSKVWDPNKRTAVVMIDGNVVWESNDVGTDVRGQYRNQAINVQVDDLAPYKLTLALRSDVNEDSTNVEYYTDWDFVRFEKHCAGLGFLPGDFTRDCYVDGEDLKLLSEKWVGEVDTYDLRNLYSDDDIDPNGVINFFDFALYGQVWDGNEVDLREFSEKWLDLVAPDDQYNLYRDDDINATGVINFFDFGLFAEDWMYSSYD